MPRLAANVLKLLIHDSYATEETPSEYKIIQQ
jgi:hypothetical protein